MDFKIIAEAISEYNSLDPNDVHNQIVPIIKSYDKNTLSSLVGLSEQALYAYCKSWYVAAGKKPPFEIYVKLMSFGINPEHKIYNGGKPVIRKGAGRKKKPSPEDEILKIIYSEHRKEEQAEKRAKYQHDYYMRVTKKKRQEKRNGKTKENS